MRTIDLFCGCGGLSLGFSQSGFCICAAVDNWKSAREVYARNFSHPVFDYDLRNTDKAIECLSPFVPEMVIGGPPCQDFSSAGKRAESGLRADLTQSFAALVIGLNPTWFVMENVVRARQNIIFQSAVRMLRDAGYGLTIVALDAAYCGVPQTRKRLFVVGERGGRDAGLEEILGSHLSPEPLTVRRYLASIQMSFGVEHYYRHPRTYARRGVFSVDEPSATIRGVNRPVPPGYHPHPGDTMPPNPNLRPLTTWERAILQTFPPDFIFLGNKADQEQLIGNAVPPRLAEYVAHAILQYRQHSANDLQAVSRKNHPQNVQLTFW